MEFQRAAGQIQKQVPPKQPMLRMLDDRQKPQGGLLFSVGVLADDSIYPAIHSDALVSQERFRRGPLDGESGSGCW